MLPRFRIVEYKYSTGMGCAQNQNQNDAALPVAIITICH
jgi:hypothetical protein